MEVKDYFMRQLQQAIQAILRRLLNIADLVRYDNQDQFAEELKDLLEDVTGLSIVELQTADLNTLGYLLKIKTSGEMRFCLEQVLNAQATFAEKFPEFGSADRWHQLAERIREPGASPAESDPTPAD